MFRALRFLPLSLESSSFLRRGNASSFGPKPSLRGLKQPPVPLPAPFLLPSPPRAPLSFSSARARGASLTLRRPWDRQRGPSRALQKKSRGKRTPIRCIHYTQANGSLPLGAPKRRHRKGPPGAGPRVTSELCTRYLLSQCAGTGDWSVTHPGKAARGWDGRKSRFLREAARPEIPPGAV